MDMNFTAATTITEAALSLYHHNIEEHLDVLIEMEELRNEEILERRDLEERAHDVINCSVEERDDCERMLVSFTPSSDEELRKHALRDVRIRYLARMVDEGHDEGSARRYADIYMKTYYEDIFRPIILKGRNWRRLIDISRQNLLPRGNCGHGRATLSVGGMTIDGVPVSWIENLQDDHWYSLKLCVGTEWSGRDDYRVGLMGWTLERCEAPFGTRCGRKRLKRERFRSALKKFRATQRSRAPRREGA